MAGRNQKRYRTLNDCKFLFKTVLRGWRIRYSKKPSDPPWPHVFIDHKKMRAVVYPFDHNKGSKRRKTPSDYFLHETLHVCMRAIYEAKEKYWREEQFIQLICQLIDG